MSDNRNLERAVCDTIAQVIRDSGRAIVQVHPEDRLREALALDSMDLAVIVVRLEQQLGVDPFRQRRQPVQTVGDLITAYQELTASLK